MTQHPVASTFLSRIGRALICAGCLLSAGCDKATPTDRETPTAPSARVGAKEHEGVQTRVEIAKLEPSTAALTLELPGEVEASRDALLASSLGGYVERVQVKVGDRVKKGQALVWVDSSGHRARVRQAQVEVDASKREVQRAEQLGAAIPKAELDAAKARHDAAAAALSSARVSLGRTTITAPFAGSVVDLNAEVGEVPAPGAPLVRLVQLTPAKVTLSVSDRDVVVLEEGMPARVSVQAGGSPIPGVVKHIRRAADLKTRAFQVEVEVPNTDERLLPGMIAQVRLDIAGDKPRIIVSQDWLVTRGSEVGAFVSEGDRARWRLLTLGAILRDRVLVDSGLKAGDLIVTTGHRGLADGDRLLVSRRGVCCTDGRVVFP